MCSLLLKGIYFSEFTGVFLSSTTVKCFSVLYHSVVDTASPRYNDSICFQRCCHLNEFTVVKYPYEQNDMQKRCFFPFFTLIYSHIICFGYCYNRLIEVILTNIQIMFYLVQSSCMISKYLSPLERRFRAR